jgi:spore germination protein YaaH
LNESRYLRIVRIRASLFRTAPLASLITLGAAAPARAQRLEALWYLRGERSIQSFIAHADQISIVAPQVFSIDSNGRIHGRLDPRVIETARAHHVKIMPLITNGGFDQPTLHRILTNHAARNRALTSITSLCRANKFDGLQFDFENFNVRDKDAFTRFTRQAVDSVHRAGCQLSAAVVPRPNDDAGVNSYEKWMYDNWRGAFDYKALADTLDFISYMTYAQHTGGSPPGPVAGYPWMKSCLEFLLSLGVPPSKISLGLASYSDWWYPTYDRKHGARVRGSDVSYEHVMAILDSVHVSPIWNDTQKAPNAVWDVRGVFRHAWIEDARAFMAKLELARTYHLRGYSVWVLGTEDPSTWTLLRENP